QPLADRLAELDDVVARRAIAFGQLGDLARDSLGVSPRPLGYAESFAERRERGALLFGDLTVEPRDPTRERVDEKTIFFGEARAIDGAEIDPLARRRLDLLDGLELEARLDRSANDGVRLVRVEPTVGPSDRRERQKDVSVQGDGPVPCSAAAGADARLA